MHMLAIKTHIVALWYFSFKCKILLK